MKALFEIYIESERLRLRDALIRIRRNSSLMISAVEANDVERFATAANNLLEAQQDIAAVGRSSLDRHLVERQKLQQARAANAYLN